VYLFGGRAITALAVVFGLAMLDLGPRASAAFLPVVSLSPQAETGAGESAGSGAPDISQDLQVWPPRSSDVRLVQTALCNPDAPSSSGAGSSSSSSSGSGQSSPLATDGLQVLQPGLVARLRAAAVCLSSQLFISAIFEPPRVGV
jgi:hypothetical protein